MARSWETSVLSDHPISVCAGLRPHQGNGVLLKLARPGRGQIVFQQSTSCFVPFFLPVCCLADNTGPLWCVQSCACVQSFISWEGYYSPLLLTKISRFHVSQKWTSICCWHWLMLYWSMSVHPRIGRGSLQPVCKSSCSVPTNRMQLAATGTQTELWIT